MNAMPPASQPSLIRSSSSIFFQDIFLTGVLFVANIFIARWLGPERLGLLYIVNLLPTYAEKFGRLGMVDHAAVYYLGRKRHDLTELVNHLTVIGLAYGLLYVVLFALFSKEYADHFVKTPVPAWYLWVALATVPFTFIIISYGKILVSTGETKSYNVTQVAKAFSFLAGAVIFAAIGLDIGAILLGTLLSVVTASFLAFLFLKRQARISVVFPFNWPLVKDLHSYGWKIHFCSIVTFLHQRADLLIVAKILSSADVSFYSLAVSGNQMLWKISDAVSSVLFPKISQQKDAAGNELTAKVIRNVSVILIFCALGLAVVVYPLVMLVYGGRYEPLIVPCLMLLPGTVMMAICRIINAHLYGQGRPFDIFSATWPCAVLNITLNLFLAERGIVYVAAISSLTYSINAVLLTHRFKRGTALGYRDIFIMTAGDWAYWTNLKNRKAAS